LNPPHHSPYHAWLHRYAVLVAVCTLILVTAGAAVTSKEAGLSVPDWPLSYGDVFPEMTGGVLFETGHRLIATTVGFMTILLAVWIQRVDRRRWMRRLGWTALVAVIVQGLLGGITVLWLQPPWVSTAHACLAQLFFSTTCAIALFTSRRWLDGAEIVEDYGKPSLRSLAILAPVLVLGQIALGAAFRHRAIGLMPHIAGSMLVTLALLIVGVFVLTQFPKHAALRKAAHGMLGVTAMQVFLGIGAYFARLTAAESPIQMVIVTVAHVANGGLTLAFTILLSIQIRRYVQLRVTQPAPAQQAVAS
jgi:cytochrome c oxidase assembly protein subunit 15